MLNRIVIQGRLCADPELRRTNSGTPVTTVNVAVDRDFKNQDGSRDTDFIPIVAWKGTGEMLAKYFSKGRMIVVEGRLQLRDWTDKEGSKRRTAEVVANSVYFGDSKSSDTQSAPASMNPVPVSTADFQEVDDDGQLPF